MNTERREVLDRFLDEMRAEFPRFRIIKKEESPFSKAIDVALRIVTFNGQREFMTRYYTVIGDTLYVPQGFDNFDPVDVVITLRHERIHLRQRRRYTFLGMSIIYLLLPFPLGLAYGRARIEWEAYTETLRAVRELKGEQAMRSQALRQRIISQFTSAAYGWMWPFRSTIERWYDEALKEIERQR
ncbi:MAG: hypothetical protein HOW73_36205 [Polyangiaceae bacterium]|nr:hypothetical protein [Polyangiaceae bacterium]